ncbi:chromosomal replication initiator protein DnaA [Desulfosediminicola flagellatus]|uniref:chromosomal replication initiator protein DnaA n=1 Tax=Desulfosediminicola flagellatus TaxID=2569541 RepID=UPI0010ACC141|nr:chromosomal replication initiator protein DnaA [Desulfosediminicola flagellatus]
MLWEKTQEVLKDTLSGSVYQLWIEPLRCLEVRDDSIYLLSPDRYFSAYVAQKFLSIIEATVKEAGSVQRRVVICEDERVHTPKPVMQPKGQLRLPTVPENNSSVRALHPRYTFDQYMVGDCNILAESACKAISADDDSYGPCIYINSETGLGKSHLTHAIAHKVFAESPMTRLHYVTAQQFAAEMVRNIQSKTMDTFKQKYHDHCDMLLVEDIHSLTGKKKTQEELNEVLDSLIKSGKRVVLTANQAPRELVGIDSEFRSRMSSGLVTMIKAPDINTRLRIVERKAGTHQLGLAEEGVNYLAQHIRGDIRQVESAIVAIRAKSRLMGGHVDMDMIREAVTSVVGVGQQLTIQMISDLIAKQFKVSVDDMKSRSRKRQLTFPRQVAMYLCRKYTDDSLAEIGRAFNRDHSTVMHSIKKVTNLSVRDTSVAAQMELLTGKVKSL